MRSANAAAIERAAGAPATMMPLEGQFQIERAQDCDIAEIEAVNNEVCAVKIVHCVPLRTP
jgi:hypothetical protein